MFSSGASLLLQSLKSRKANICKILKGPLVDTFWSFYLALSGPLMMYPSAPSQDTDLEQNYNHYSQSHSKLSSGRHFSVAALNAHEEARGGV